MVCVLVSLWHFFSTTSLGKNVHTKFLRTPSSNEIARAEDGLLSVFASAIARKHYWDQIAALIYQHSEMLSSVFLTGEQLTLFN